jgi:hypothetical protein
MAALFSMGLKIVFRRGHFLSPWRDVALTSLVTGFSLPRLVG